MSGVLLKDTSPVARKKHFCMLCGTAIQKNTRYRRCTLARDGRVYDFINCMQCEDCLPYVYNYLHGYDDEGITGADVEEWASETVKYGPRVTQEYGHAAAYMLRGIEALLLRGGGPARKLADETT